MCSPNFMMYLLSLWNDVAAINRQRHTRHVGGRIGGEPENGVRYLVWIGQSPQRYASGHALPGLLIGDPAFVHRGQGRTGGNGIDANVLPGIFEGGRFRQADDAMFTGDVGSDATSGASKAHESHRGTQVDDGASSRDQHGGDLVLHAQEDALEIGRDDPVKKLLAPLHPWHLASPAPRRVAADIQPPLAPTPPPPQPLHHT